MSRYILTPAIKDGQENIFHLIPTEGIIEQSRNIELPYDIIPKYDVSGCKMSEKRLNNFMLKLSKANIGKSKDGFIVYGSKMFDTKFDDFVMDCCKHVFLDKYEYLYVMLRNNGITF